MSPSAIFFFVNELYLSCLVLFKSVLCSSVCIVCTEIPCVNEIYHILIFTINLGHSTIQDCIISSVDLICLFFVSGFSIDALYSHHAKPFRSGRCLRLGLALDFDNRLISSPFAVFFFVNEFYFSCLVLCKYVFNFSVCIVCTEIPCVNEIYHILIFTINLGHSTIQDCIISGVDLICLFFMSGFSVDALYSHHAKPLRRFRHLRLFSHIINPDNLCIIIHIYSCRAVISECERDFGVIVI